MLSDNETIAAQFIGKTIGAIIGITFKTLLVVFILKIIKVI